MFVNKAMYFSIMNDHSECIFRIDESLMCFRRSSATVGSVDEIIRGEGLDTESDGSSLA
jgi:hypothetical protein